MRQPTPFVFSVLRHYKDKHISLSQARAALSMVERFHFAYTAVAGQSSSGGVSKMYAASGRDLSLGQSSQKRASHLQAFNKKLADRFPDERIFAAGFSDIRSSQLETRSRPLVRYILELVDATHRVGGPADYSKMTIEHIAPQNPKSGKPSVNYASVGNLIFVSESLNDKLKNKSFGDKMKILKDNNVPLDDVLKNATQWSDKDIAARTKHLSSIAYQWAKKG
jgi:uncharacterized protein DUF1524